MFNPLLGTHTRVEHWASALHQPETVAAAMLSRDAAYDRVPACELLKDQRNGGSQ